MHFNEDMGLFGRISGQEISERDPKAAREAFDGFKELVTRFPNSKYTPDSIQRMNYLVNALASHEVHVARLPERGLCGAANRVQFSLKTIRRRRDERAADHGEPTRPSASRTCAMMRSGSCARIFPEPLHFRLRKPAGAVVEALVRT